MEQLPRPPGYEQVGDDLKQINASFAQDAVLLMLERVGDAQRIATMQMRETDKRRKGKRKGGGDNDDRDGDDGQMCAAAAAEGLRSSLSPCSICRRLVCCADRCCSSEHDSTNLPLRVQV